ncbi:MAG TPA: TIGR03016 family PEP-CTERM system-associated outer membrane protein [Gammaproteobacteria bacterium]|nr:TIGR03016 family PEP-CTERM system-associated outer membrane protein [Gammaproteobacteria bacterium]
MTARGRADSRARVVHGWPVFAGLVLVIYGTVVRAAAWEWQSSLVLGEIYTDNLTLSSAGRTESEWVTEITPGIRASREGARIKMDAAYRLQNLLYGNDSDRNNTRHQLNARASAEVIRDHFFIDAKSTVSQQIVDPDRSVAADRITPGSTSDVFTYGVSPYARFRLGRFADAALRYDVGWVEQEGNMLSDGRSEGYSATLASGRGFSRLLWQFAYHRSELDRGDQTDSVRENGSGSLRYRLFEHFSLLAQGGYENNDVATSRSVRNGEYWSGGFLWVPSGHFSFEATRGHNLDSVSMRISPSRRLNLQLGYRKFDLGLNPGDSWTASLSYRLRRTTWLGSYTETSTNVQTLQLAGQQVFALVDIDGNPIIDPTTGQPIVLVSNVFALTDEEFLSKRGRLTVVTTTAKSNYIFALFDERREYELSLRRDTVRGANASWSWRFARRTSSRLSGNWLRSSSSVRQGHDDSWQLAVGLFQSTGRDVTSSLEYRHARSNPSEGRDSYRENRITARMTINF